MVGSSEIAPLYIPNIILYLLTKKSGFFLHICKIKNKPLNYFYLEKIMNFIPSLEKPLTLLNYPHTHESALNFLSFTFIAHKFSNNLYFIILFLYLHLKVNIEKKNLK